MYMFNVHSILYTVFLQLRRALEASEKNARCVHMYIHVVCVVCRSWVMAIMLPGPCSALQEYRDIYEMQRKRLESKICEPSTQP